VSLLSLRPGSASYIPPDWRGLLFKTLWRERESGSKLFGVMARFNANMEPSAKRCRYWEAGRPCWNSTSGRGCKHHHSVDMLDVNKCHKYLRHDCKHGHACHYIHIQGTGAARSGCNPGSVYLVKDGSLCLASAQESIADESDYSTKAAKALIVGIEEEMEKDRQVLDKEARTRKLKAVYLKQCHPDKCFKGIGTLEPVANKVTQLILELGPWYCR
jgi:hypothetical protein